MNLVVREGKEAKLKTRVLIILGSLTIGLSASLGVATAAHKAAAGGGPSAVPGFSSLGQARQPTDFLPAALQRVVDTMNANPAPVSADLFEGKQLGDQSRLLASNLGVEKAAIYAYPTSKGRVCFINTAGAGGCVTAANPAAWALTVTPTNGIMLYGLVPDAVRSVDVLVGGSTVPATLQQNAFFYEQQDTTTTPTSVVVTFAGGRQQTFKLPDRATLLRTPGS